MAKIPKVYSENLINKTVSKAPFKAGAKGFNLYASDALLKSTGQYLRWQNIRQNNDDLAKKTAALIVKRHGLIEDAKKGLKIDRIEFDNLTSEIAKSGIFLFDSSNLIKNRYSWAKNIEKIEVPKNDITTKQTPSQKIEPEIFDEELILEVRYRNYTISKGILSLNEDGNEYYPLKGAGAFLDTKVDQVSENIYHLNDHNKNNAILNLNDKKLNLADETIAIKDNDFRLVSGELYLSKDLLSKIYNSDFILNKSEMLLEVKPISKLPFMEKIERSKKNIFQDYSNGISGLSKLEQPYSTQRFPLIDFQGGLGIDSKEDDNYVGDYTINGRGEFFKGGVKFFIKGDEDETPERFDILAERVNPERESFRDLSRVAIGDIKHRGFSVFSTTDTEKGIRIESRNLNRPVDFDSTDFSGNLLPGWDVELYRNNVLIGKDTSGNDGKFDFDDVPLFYGENRFKLVYYGPYGEKREEDKVIKIGSGMKKPGEISYDLSLSSKEKNTLAFEDEVKGIDYESPRFSASFNAGVGDRLSIEGGIRSEDIENERHNYLSGGITGSIFGTLVKGGLFFDDSGGEGGLVSVQSRINDINLRVKNTFLNNFIKDGTAVDDLEKFISEGSLSGLLFKDSKIPVSWSVSEKYTKKEDSYLNSLSFRQGINQGDFSLYNSSTWQKSSSLGSNQLTGALNSTIKLKEIKLQSEVGYEVFPDTELENIAISGRKDISNEINSNVKLEHSFENDLTSLSGSLSFDLDKWRLSPEATIDSNGDWKVYAGLGMSVGRDPNTKDFNLDSQIRSPFGEVSAIVFEDNNLNGVRDKGEKPLKGVRIEAPGTGFSSDTDENGIALIKRLSPYKKSEIIINESTIEDPLMVSSNKGHSIHPRPGRIEKMEFPVFRSGEITGHIYIKDENGIKRELGYEKIILESKDSTFSKEIQSDFDGYYVLDQIPPGDYILKSGGSQNLLNYEKEVKISESKNLGEEIVLVQKAITDTSIAKNEENSAVKRVLYANQKWNTNLGFSPKDNKIPDEAIMIYENGEWVLKEDGLSNYGVHIASFKDFDIAKNYILEKSKEFDKEFMVKKSSRNNDTWYRILYGKSKTRNEAESLEKEIKDSADYTSILNIC